MKTDPDDIVAIILAGLLVVIVLGGIATLGLWVWRDSSDRSDCRRAGGTVEMLRGDEWRCVGGEGGKP